MPSEKPVITFVVDPELLKRIDDFRFENRISARSKVLRLLIEAGLKALNKEKSPQPLVTD